jgi:hypothetical protein
VYYNKNKYNKLATPDRILINICRGWMALYLDLKKGKESDAYVWIGLSGWEGGIW